MRRDYYIRTSWLITCAYGIMVILAYIYPWINNSNLWMLCYMFQVELCGLNLLKNSKIKLSTNVKLWLFTLLPIVFNSYSIQVREFGYLIMWGFLLILMFIAQNGISYVKRIMYLLLGLCSIYAMSTVMINIGFSMVFEGIAESFRGSTIAQGTIKTAGLTAHYSHNGMYIAVGCLVMSAIYLMKEKKKWYEFILMLFFYAGLLLTQKRGPLIAVCIGVVLTFFVAKHESLSSKIRRIMLFSTATLATIYILYIAFPELFRIIDRFSSDNVLSNRGYLWDYAIRLFKSNPLIGTGWGSYSHNLNLSIDSVGVSNQNAHNIYLQLLAETGIIGFSFFIIPMIYSLIESIKLLQRMGAQHIDCAPMFMSVSVQLFFIVYGMTGNPLYDKQMVLVYMISIAFYLSYGTIYKNASITPSNIFEKENLYESRNYNI